MFGFPRVNNSKTHFSENLAQIGTKCMFFPRIICKPNFDIDLARAYIWFDILLQGNGSVEVSNCPYFEIGFVSKWIFELDKLCCEWRKNITVWQKILMKDQRHSLCIEVLTKDGKIWSPFLSHGNVCNNVQLFLAAISQYWPHCPSYQTFIKQCPQKCLKKTVFGSGGIQSITLEGRSDEEYQTWSTWTVTCSLGEHLLEQQQQYERRFLKRFTKARRISAL